MRKHSHGVIAASGAVACSLLLASCSAPAPDRPSSASSAPLPASSLPAAPDYEALWHLRVGLNVAALICTGGGRVPVRDEYGRMLHLHRDVLATGYDYEVQRYGRTGNDRHQTQLYNRFSNQPEPGRWCRTAKQVVDQALGMESALLSRSAPGLLADLSGGIVIASTR